MQRASKPISVIAVLAAVLSACSTGDSVPMPVLEPADGVPNGAGPQIDGVDPWEEQLKDASTATPCLGRLADLSDPQAASAWAVSSARSDTRDRMEPPFAVAGTVEILNIEDATQRPCLLLVEFEPSVHTQRRLLGEQTVEAMRLIEPAASAESDIAVHSHAGAVDRNYEAEEDERTAKKYGAQELRTGDPFIDFIGTAAMGLFGLAGSLIDEMKRSSAESAALREAAIMPVTESYTFPAMEIETERSGLYRIALVDRTTGRTLQTERTRSEKAQFLLTDARDPDDIGVSTDLPIIDMKSLAGWELAGPAMPLSEIATALRSVSQRSAEASATTDPRAIRAAWRSGMTRRAVDVTADPMLMASFARISSFDGDAVGVFIAPETVLTASTALPANGLVEVRPESGVGTYAVVRKRDPGSGLALLHVPHAGPVIRLAEPALHEVDSLDVRALAGGRLQPVNFREIDDAGKQYRLLMAGGDTLPGTPLVREGALVGLLTKMEAGGYRVADLEAIRNFIATMNLPPSS